MFPKTLLDLNSILSEKGIKIKIETNPIKLPNNPFHNKFIRYVWFSHSSYLLQYFETHYIRCTDVRLKK